jgi:predicted RNA-binding Zn-ribbon protein involved in translation (DUF1610 family)
MCIPCHTRYRGGVPLLQEEVIMFTCARCGKAVVISGRVSRSFLCPACGAYLHSCVNCRFYRPGSHNDCREPQAELVSDKKGSNFCDYFAPADRPAGNRAATERNKDDREKQRERFDKLFGE